MKKINNKGIVEISALIGYALGFVGLMAAVASPVIYVSGIKTDVALGKQTNDNQDKDISDINLDIKDIKDDIKYVVRLTEKVAERNNIDPTTVRKEVDAKTNFLLSNE